MQQPSLNSPCLMVECPVCGMAPRIPCIKLTIEVGRFKRVQKYFRAPHKMRVEAYHTKIALRRVR
jgi:hypothetical protein